MSEEKKVAVGELLHELRALRDEGSIDASKTFESVRSVVLAAGFGGGYPDIESALKECEGWIVLWMHDWFTAHAGLKMSPAKFELIDAMLDAIDELTTRGEPNVWHRWTFNNLLFTQDDIKVMNSSNPVYGDVAA